MYQVFIPNSFFLTQQNQEEQATHDKHLSHYLVNYQKEFNEENEKKYFYGITVVIHKYVPRRSRKYCFVLLFVALNKHTEIAHISKKLKNSMLFIPKAV